jgi:hypothetical protein
MAVIVKHDLPFLGFAGPAAGLRAVPRTERFEPYMSRYAALCANWRTGRLADLKQPLKDKVFDMEPVRVG